MNHSNKDDIAFVRLNTIAESEITAHMSDTRLQMHMPLLGHTWDVDDTRTFIAAKENCWQQDGLGHWAFLINGRYAGWGGFQKEGEEWDFGLVLKTDCFGAGPAIVCKALEFARQDPRIPYVTFLLPPTRTKLGALLRLGARFVAYTQYSGTQFLKFRLETGSHTTD